VSYLKLTPIGLEYPIAIYLLINSMNNPLINSMGNPLINSI